MVQQTQRSFQDIKEEYDGLFQTEPIRDDDSGYRWHGTQVLRAKPNAERILDIACGGGYFFRELLKLKPSLQLTGIDISPEAIEIAKQECPSAEYKIGVGENLPFEANSFDAITCLGSLEHFLDIGKAIGQMQKVAKPDAIYYILVPNLFWYKDIRHVLFTGNRLTRNQTHERFACLGEWIETLEQFGLRPVETLKYNGIAKHGWKQTLKDLLIPVRFSYHFVFICKAG